MAMTATSRTSQGAGSHENEMLFLDELPEFDPRVLEAGSLNGVLLYVVGRVSVPRAGRRSEFAQDARNRAANDGAHSRLQITRLSGERLARARTLATGP